MVSFLRTLSNFWLQCVSQISIVNKKIICRFGTHRHVVQECWRCRQRCVAKRRWWSSLDQSSTLWTLLIASRRWTCTHRFSLSLG